MFFASPPAMAETRSPASTVSHDNMDDFQTPTAMTGAILISACSTTQHASSKDTASSESSHLHDPPGLVQSEIPLVDGMQQRQHSSSHTVSPTQSLALPEPSSIEMSASAVSIDQGTVSKVINPPSATKGSLDSVTPKERPKKKKKRNLRKAQHASASLRPGQINGEIESAAKQTVGGPSVDRASPEIHAELAQVDGIPFGNSQDAVALLQKPNVPLGELNSRTLASGEQAISAVAAHDSQGAARKKGHSWPKKRLPNKNSPKALSDQTTPPDAGNIDSSPPKNPVREPSSQRGESTLKESQHLVPRSETGLSRSSNTEQSRASQLQLLKEKVGRSRGRRYAPRLSKIEETAIAQTLGTCHTFNTDQDAKSSGAVTQPQSKITSSDNCINDGLKTTGNPLSSNTRQPTAPENGRRVFIPKSRYTVRRIPIHAKENLIQDEAQDAQKEPHSRDLANIPVLPSHSNKDAVEVPIDTTSQKLLPKKEDHNNNVESSKGRLTPSQKNRLKMRQKKEQARVAADLDAGVSIQSGLAQAQPSYSHKPHTSEQPSQRITVPNTNLAMSQNPSSVMHQPISPLGQIQNLLRGMNPDHRHRSRGSSIGRGSSMGRSRGSQPAQGRVIASADTTTTGPNQFPSFGHESVERRQRGFQPQLVPAATHHVTAGQPEPIPHQHQLVTSAGEDSSAAAVLTHAVRIVTMDASIPEADPVHIEQAPSAFTRQSPRGSRTMSAVNGTPRPRASVDRSSNSAIPVASPQAVTSGWDIPSTSSQNLDWSKSITPNNFSFNDLPTYNLQPRFLSRERKKSMVHPQPTLSRIMKDTVPVPTEDHSMKVRLVKNPTPKENENPSSRPKNAEPQNPQILQGQDDGNVTYLPPHLRPPSQPKQPVNVPDPVAALKLTAITDFEEEDAHLPPHLRRPARKDKPLKASPVSFVAAEMPQKVLPESIGHMANQTQHILSTESGKERVPTPPNLTQSREDPTSTQATATSPYGNPPNKSALPAIPERAAGQSKAFDNVRPTKPVWGQKSNAPGSASIDSNAAVNDGETRPKTTLQYEPQLHDWEGKWAPAPVEWDARPSFDNTDARHLRAIERWLDERAEAALNKPIQINIRDPDFLNGGKPAGGLQTLNSPVEDEVSETLLPNDPFTHARIHQTAEGSALAYHKKVYKEKKHSKEDRKALKVATRLHYESYVPPPNPHVPKANIYIRPAVASDMRQITQLYNHYVQNSVVASERVELTEAQWRVRWQDCTGEHHAFLVAVLKSGNRSGRFRRDNSETVVGFAYAEDFSESGNMFRFTCELQFWVHHQHLRLGIGKTLVDRMIPALDNGYCSRQGTDFVADNPLAYDGGGLRTITRILISIPYDANDAKDFIWQKKWLTQWGFEQVSNLPGIGRKLDKDINVAQLMKITSVLVPKAG
ncbi:MAG: hypothetical protein FRX48_04339 [Lasallia pustulata]|uniref:Acyl-CoA N-acyltransferase n=1 Tax=Lasallia pustulata TaxID=136370 RepID=A0A5M8PRZ1_9LECA|nr:MAG: hypothetical protein FRX48_04339 [Lasallia pustulata]